MFKFITHSSSFLVAASVDTVPEGQCSFTSTSPRRAWVTVTVAWTYSNVYKLKPSNFSFVTAIGKKTLSVDNQFNLLTRKHSSTMHIDRFVTKMRSDRIAMRLNVDRMTYACENLFFSLRSVTKHSSFLQICMRVYRLLLCEPTSYWPWYSRTKGCDPPGIAALSCISSDVNNVIQETGFQSWKGKYNLNFKIKETCI